MCTTTTGNDDERHLKFDITGKTIMHTERDKHCCNKTIKSNLPYGYWICCTDAYEAWLRPEICVWECVMPLHAADSKISQTLRISTAFKFRPKIKTETKININERFTILSNSILAIHEKCQHISAQTPFRIWCVCDDKTPSFWIFNTTKNK